LEKQKREHRPKRAQLRPGERFHSDLCGPFNSSLSGHRYFLTFIDEHSRYVVVHLLKSKDEAFRKFQEFDLLMYNKFERPINSLHTDNGGEYKNISFKEYCSAYGIFQDFTTAHHPHQNGIAERQNYTLMD